MEEHKSHRPLIGVSACLSGETVRYDASHKRQSLMMSLLPPHARLSPFCPEVEAGLGVPRPPVQLIETSAGHVRARGVEDRSLDVTDALEGWAEDFCRHQVTSLSGFVFKSRSPSCGLGSTPVRDQSGRILGNRDGLFAQRLREVAPWLPFVEESWLDSSEHCYRFLTACWAVAWYRHDHPRHRDLMALLTAELPLGDLSSSEALHTAVSYLLSPASAHKNKTALWGRLCDYWQAQDSEPG